MHLETEGCDTVVLHAGTPLLSPKIIECISVKMCIIKSQSRNLIQKNRPLADNVAEASAVQPADIQTQS